MFVSLSKIEVEISSWLCVCQLVVDMEDQANPRHRPKSVQIFHSDGDSKSESKRITSASPFFQPIQGKDDLERFVGINDLRFYICF